MWPLATSPRAPARRLASRALVSRFAAQAELYPGKIVYPWRSERRSTSVSSPLGCTRKRFFNELRVCSCVKCLVPFLASAAQGLVHVYRAASCAQRLFERRPVRRTDISIMLGCSSRRTGDARRGRKRPYGMCSPGVARLTGSARLKSERASLNPNCDSNPIGDKKTEGLCLRPFSVSPTGFEPVSPGRKPGVLTRLDEGDMNRRFSRRRANLAMGSRIVNMPAYRRSTSFLESARRPFKRRRAIYTPEGRPSARQVMLRDPAS